VGIRADEVDEREGDDELADLKQAAQLLSDFYDKWENGAPCYEDPEECAGSLGQAVQLGDMEDQIIVVLNRLFPRTPEAAPALASSAFIGQPVVRITDEYADPQASGAVMLKSQSGANFVQVVDELTAGNPSCQVCGVVMIALCACGETPYSCACNQDFKVNSFKCLSCGATIKPTESAAGETTK